MLTLARNLATGAILLLAAFLGVNANAATWYVDKDNTGTEDGTSWATAFKTIQPAVNAASAAGGGEVWVAEGTYSETRPHASGALELKSTVSLYGGFAGNETQRSERDLSAHTTIIDGSTARAGSAAYHVVLGAEDSGIDGFTVTGGNANGGGENDRGGGIYNNLASCIVTNCCFKGNAAAVGGGMYNYACSPALVNCVFLNNTANSGGGLFNNQPAAWPQIMNCSFYGNSSVDGSAIHNHNAANTTATNCILWNSLTPEIVDTGGSTAITYSDVQGGYTGTGNKNENPRFASTTDLRLCAGSPCIDTGTATGAPLTDIEGTLRTWGGGPDMGAYEFASSSLEWSHQRSLNARAALDASDIMDREVDIESDHNGNWVAVWACADDFYDSNGYTQHNILAARSSDGGNTWSTPVLINAGGTPTDYRDHRDPKIATDGKGTWIVVWSGWIAVPDGNNGVIFSRSTDNGATWSTKSAITTGGMYDGSAQISTNGNGRWVVVFHCRRWGTDTDIAYSRSDDNGSTWSSPAALCPWASTDTEEDDPPSITTDRKGTWVVVWTTPNSPEGIAGSDYDVLSSRSVDNGITWSAPGHVNTDGATDIAYDRFGSQQNIVTDGNGRWFVLWSSSQRWNANIDVAMAQSLDNGITWSTPKQLNQRDSIDTDDYYPLSIDYDEAGNYVVVWNHENADLHWSRSEDGGTTWYLAQSLNQDAVTGPYRTASIASDARGHWVAIYSANENLGGITGTDYDIFVTTLDLMPNVPVSSGTFTMGRRDDGDDGTYGQTTELPRHEVTLSAYNIGKFEVTNGQFAAVLNWAKGHGYLKNSDGSYYSSGDVYVDEGDRQQILFLTHAYCPITYTNGAFGWKTRDTYSMEHHPVTTVTWHGAVAFCNWLSEAQGLTPCYDLKTWEIITPYPDGYRLPTEAEWERAAAWDSDAGKHWIYGMMTDTLTGKAHCSYGDGSPSGVNPLGLTELPYTSPAGWFDGVHVSPNGSIATVDSPSPAGCYDMSGNVWEWCHDKHLDTYYSGGSMTDPTGPVSGTGREMRGGSWGNAKSNSRTAYRPGGLPQNYRDNYTGFRVARSPIHIPMVDVAGGTFTMGRRDDGDDGAYGGADELPRHEVTLSPYKIGKFEITNGQFATVLNWANARGYLKNSTGAAYTSGDVYVDEGSLQLVAAVSESTSDVQFVNGTFAPKTRDGYSMVNHPVVWVSWFGAVCFCNWLSEMEGLTPCYTLTTWALSVASGGYRLPTEAEWEYAAGWNTSGSTHWIYGFQSDTLTGKARCNYYDANPNHVNPMGMVSEPYTSPAGWFNGVNISPNGSITTVDSFSPAGCYDMSGGVNEWCHDWYDSYGTGSQIDPIGPGFGSDRTMRGGSWPSSWDSCRSAFRNHTTPGDHRYFIGFRITRSSEAGPMTAPVVEITPDFPTSSDDLVCTVTTPSAPYSVQYEFSWSNGGTPIVHGPQSGLVDTLNASETSRGDTWTCIVRGYYGGDYSDPGEDSVTIVNTPPGAPVLTFPAQLNDSTTLECSIQTASQDADGDPVTYAFAWWRKPSGGSYSTFTSAFNQTTRSRVFADDTTVGDLWYCVVTPNDGADDGTPATSPECTIIQDGEITLEPSSISCILSASEITLGQTLTVSGSIVGKSPVGTIVSFTTNSPSGVHATDFPEAVAIGGTAYSRLFYPTEASEGRSPWLIQASWPGDVYYQNAISNWAPFAVKKAQPTLTLSLNASSVPMGFSDLQAEAVLSGPLPAQLQTLVTGQTVNLWMKKPDASSAGPVAGTTGAGGKVVFPASAFTAAGITFSSPGTWQFLVEFEGSQNLLATTSEGYDKPESVRLTVKDKAGYAIVVVGKLDATGEGMDEHRKTGDYVYRAFRDRGFAHEDIYYLREGPAQPAADIFVDDRTPSQADVTGAIQNWAVTQMNTSPAPLYIVLIDHGGPSKFYVYSGSYNETRYITPSELAGYLNFLQASLNTASRNQKVALVMGSCYSGSFVEAVSGANRVVITSTSKNEVSHRGVLEKLGLVRDGEAFTTEFFRNAREGKTLKESFERATDKTLTYTATKSNGASALFKQHPLLDDNGDGTGSEARHLAFASGNDGSLAHEMVLGYGVNATGSVGWITSTQTLMLGPADPVGQLFAKATDIPATGHTAWIEVKTPEYAGSTTVDPANEDSQKYIDLPSFDYETAISNLDTGYFRWETFGTTFDAPGTYNVFYYVQDGVTKETSSFLMTTIYRQSATNRPPTLTTLNYPGDGMSVYSTSFFAWTSVTDPDGDPLTYRLEIAEDDSFSTGLRFKEGISVTAVSMSGLQDGQTYYWRVIPVDVYGASPTGSMVRHFIVDNHNPALPGYITGVIKDLATGTPVEGAEVTISPNGTSMSTTARGEYFLPNVAEGTYMLMASKDGYQDASEYVLVSAGAATERDIALEPSSGGSYRWGELTGDARVGTLDASAIGQWRVRLITEFTAYPGVVRPAYPEAADVNGDGALNELDGSDILQWKVGITAQLPADCDGNEFGPDTDCKSSAKNALNIGERQLTLPALSGEPGTQIEVPVALDDATDVRAYFLDITFDETVLTYASFENGSLTSSWGAPNLNTFAGEVLISASSAYALSGSGTLAVLHFQIAADAAGKSSPLQLIAPELNGTQIPVQAVNGSVTVTGGSVEGMPSEGSAEEGEGVTEGEGEEEGMLVEGQTEGEAEGMLVEGQSEGEEEGMLVEGQAEGEGEEEGMLVEGQTEGSSEGDVLEGIMEGDDEGIIEGAEEGALEGETEGEVQPPFSCQCNETDFTLKDWQRLLGDLFIGCLSLMILLGWKNTGKR